MQEHDLFPNPGAHRHKRRIGRGNGSGQGTTAGKGTKGQKARSGAPRRGFEGGQIPIQKRMPYKRGFTNRFRVEYEVVNLERIIELIEEQRLEGVIDQVALARAGAVDTARPLKILGNGDLEGPIHVRTNKISASARAKIEAAGGTVELVGGEATTEEATTASDE
jgi:large subunit ribosomal protein L15